MSMGKVLHIHQSPGRRATPMLLKRKHALELPGGAGFWQGNGGEKDVQGNEVNLKNSHKTKCKNKLKQTYGHIYELNSSL